MSEERPLAEQVGELFAERRKKMGYTLREAGEVLGMANTAVSAIEKGRANPTLRFIEKMARGYGMELTIKRRR